MGLLMPRFFITSNRDNAPVLAISSEEMVSFYRIMDLKQAKMSNPSRAGFFSYEQKRELHDYNLRNLRDSSSKPLVQKIEQLADDIEWATNHGIAVTPINSYPQY